MCVLGGGVGLGGGGGGGVSNLCGYNTTVSDWGSQSLKLLPALEYNI